MNWLIKNPRTLTVDNEELQGATSNGNVTFSYNGNSTVIALTAADSGDVQAQQIADEITADTGIELTCVYENDGKTLVFDSPLTGITNSLKEITYIDTDSTGFTFESKGFGFSYAPQGRIDSSVRRYGVPDGYTVPTFFQNEYRTVVVGSNPEINFSDQEYAGNVYTWKKRSAGQTEYTTIAGETGNTLTITNFQSADQGDYILEIINPGAPDFTGEDIMRSGRITLTL